MKILKLVDCNDIFVESKQMTLENFAKEITLDSINNYNDSNKILCKIAKSIKAKKNPIMYFIHCNTIYSLEFIVGKEEVLLKELNFICNNNDIKDEYILNLITDPHRIWNTTVLNYDKIDKDKHLTNQVLSLLRICKINKDDYLQNPDVLSKKFTK